MTTSNLRNAVSGWVQLALGETDPKLRGEAIVGSVVLLCFVAGALLGGVCTLHLQAYPLLPCVVLAGAGTALTIRQRERRLSQDETTFSSTANYQLNLAGIFPRRFLTTWLTRNSIPCFFPDRSLFRLASKT
jgi:hypothetical protein